MKITIAKKLTSLTVMNLVLMAVVSVMACLASLRITHSTGDVIEMLYKMEKVDQLHFAVVESVKMNDFLISGDLGKRTAFELSLLAIEDATEDAMQHDLSSGERATLAEMERQFESLAETTRRICEEAAMPDKSFLSPSVNSMVEDADEIAASIVETTEIFHDSLQDEITGARRKSEYARSLGLAVTGISLLLAVSLGVGGSIVLIRSITKPIERLARATKVIADGNFEGNVDITTRDEIGQLGVAFNDMSDTIRKRTEELIEANRNLRETRERFRDFFKNAPVGFHIFGPDRKIMDINDAELEMIGYTKDEIVGKKTWADLILPEQETDFEGHWCDIIEKGQVQSLKYTLVHKDGRHIDVLLNASARFDEQGHLISTRGSVLNITERRRLEREFLNVIERERRKIGLELHDSIGQQLTGIKFMTDVLEQQLSDKSLEEASYAAKITAVVTGAMEQTRDLAKALHPFDLGGNDLILTLEELVTTTESLFDVSCTFVCDKSVANNDILVATNLYCIAREAITNAVRHGKAKNVRIELAGKGGKSTLTVESDGLDFPEVRAEEKGMGLKIMSYRAEMIDGAIDIHRGSNGGAVVTCVFPSKERQQ